jgi:hypothetical protein
MHDPSLAIFTSSKAHLVEKGNVVICDDQEFKPRMSAASFSTLIAVATARASGFTSLGHSISAMHSFKDLTRMPSSAHGSFLGAPASLVHLGLSGSSGLQTEPQAVEKNGTRGML